jgi:hypothetical protein
MSKEALSRINFSGSTGAKGMDPLHGTMRNGHIVLDVPSALPEGTRVEVVPVNEAPPSLGMREADWPSTPEAIAAHLQRMDQVEPGWLSDDDDAAWRAELQARKEAEKAEFLNEAKYQP